MRQLCFVAAICVLAISAGAQTPSDASTAPVCLSSTAADAANRQVQLAKLEMQRISGLVDAGALPRVRVDQAAADVADAEDDAILQKVLYCDLPPKGLDEQLADEMVAAAQRRVERQKAKIQEAQALVNEGVAAQSTVAPLQEELRMRELNLDLAHSRAKLISELASVTRYEQNMQQMQAQTSLDYRDFVTPGMEHFEGTGMFVESRDLQPLAAAFARKFAYSLPISADGESSVHRALGFDHRGRVDVAVTPTSPEGVWLKNYLKARGIPYYAFAHAMAGKATGAHIHIGPGSTRLHNAD